MQMQEIKGFPDYMFNADTGEIISKLRRKTTLKISHQYNRTAPCVQMTQNGRRRYVFYYRLRWAIEHGIGYDDMPDGLFVMKDKNGELMITDKQGQIDVANSYVKAARKRERLKRIDEKICELEIMRRAYMDGSHIEAVQYIESKKDFFTGWARKKYGIGIEKIGIVYAESLERMIQRIDSPDSQVTDLTFNMIGEMRRVYAKMRKMQPLLLSNETASNSTQ